MPIQIIVPEGTLSAEVRKARGDDSRFHVGGEFEFKERVALRAGAKLGYDDEKMSFGLGLIQRRFPHPEFKKVVTTYKKFYAHDEKSEAKPGDRVRIEETRPLSKTKRWRLVEVVERNTEVAPVAG